MITDPYAETGEYRCLPRPPSASVQVDIGALSHQGKVRSNNEDCYLVARFERALQKLLTNLPEGQLPSRLEEVGYGMLVADGIGGSLAGEVASRMAVSTLVNLVVNTPDWIMRPGERESARLMERMAERYRSVDATLKEEARADPNLSGMGTTMTVAASLGDELFLGHIGDSRAYLCRGDRLHRLTRDHTSAQALADAGLIAQEEVGKHRLRHVLTRALGGSGAKGEAEADIERIGLSDGDQILLCTDGLTEMVNDATIAVILLCGGTSQEACQILVDAALERGGKDNVTVVLARYHFPQLA
jgi:PPM family protein phosphatase